MEEEFTEMMDISAGRGLRRQGRAEGESIYSTAKEKHTREASLQRAQTRETEERERKSQKPNRRKKDN